MGTDTTEREARTMSPPHGLPPMVILEFSPRPKEAEDIPIGSIVRTPTGGLARVEAHRGRKDNRIRAGRDHRIRLVCRYLEPKNRAFDVVLLLPELVEVIHGT